MIVRLVVAITVAAVVLIGLARGLKAADWLLLRKAPDSEWQQRGPILDHEVACRTALASDGIIAPPGTWLKCERVISTKEATR